MQFSIITPTYNRAQYLPSAIQSIQQQTITDWEHIIIDDGSTDTTAQLIQDIQHSDKRIRYEQQKNSGAQAARNHGVNVANGEIIVYLDSDDIAHPELLEHIAAALTDSQKTFGIPNHHRQKIVLNHDGSIQKAFSVITAHTQGIQLQDIYHWKVRTTSSGLFHRRNVVEHGLQWDPSIKRFQDWDFLMQLGNTYPNSFAYVPEILIEYYERFGGNSMSGNASYKDWADGFESIYQKHKDDSLMQGQHWYPHSVDKNLKRQKDFEAGIIPAPQ